ncbi:hypothetical protein, partial [Bradyrhizobium sp. SZCCHNPS2010]
QCVQQAGMVSRLTTARQITRAEHQIFAALSTRLGPSSPSRENIYVSFFQKLWFDASSRPNEGALRDRHGRRVRDAVGVSGRSVIFMRTNDPVRTVKLRGPGAPVLALSSR